MLYRAMRPLLFRLDPEQAHRLALACLTATESLLVRTRYAPRPWTHASLTQRLWGIDFANPVGLAAGFDKDGRAPHVWPLLGFGFAELGTITARPQPGNPPPRLFRLTRERALINRLGFNNAGAGTVAAGLHQSFAALAPQIPIGINLGKSRAVSLEGAQADYVEAFRLLCPFAASVVINVSSPNTPGLRDLQEEKHLAGLVIALRRENEALAAKHAVTPRPLLIKLAPDLADEALASIVRVARDERIAGLVATNTTIGREQLSQPVEESGGLSGAPLHLRALEVVRTLYRLTGPALPIVGVGGIFSARDAYAMIRAGASLVQVYTGMIFEGPRLPQRIARGLTGLLQRDGLRLCDAVGRDA